MAVTGIQPIAQQPAQQTGLQPQRPGQQQGTQQQRYLLATTLAQVSITKEIMKQLREKSGKLPKTTPIEN